MNKPLDIFACPLSGRALIDASAGTGKTYTITGLVLRLLLEQDLTIEQILVVTYTEAATADLKRRIRARIRDVLLVLEGGSGDEFIDRLLAGCADNGLVKQRLIEALAGFDEAPVYTIHGFCQRLLMEYALESGAQFDQELLTDARPLLREIIADFLRRTLYNASPLFVAYARGRLAMEPLLELAKIALTGADIGILPGAAEPVGALPENIEAAFIKAFTQVKHSWPEARSEVGRIFAEGPFKRTSYKMESIPGLLAEMDTLTACQPLLGLSKNFYKFTRTGVAGGTKIRNAVPDHLFFGECEQLNELATELVSLYDAHILALRQGFVKTVEQESRFRKQRANTITFDDLLRQVLAGLNGPGGRQFAAAVSSRYPAALIDEFQDTDPVQYRIFSKIYGRDAGFLCLIGDPKQAIYSFRGADLFAYLKATALVSDRFTLDINWRATPLLVTAVNTLFVRAVEPFVLAGIDFFPVKPPQDAPKLPLQVAGDSPAPLVIWFAARPADLDKPMAKDVVRPAILRAVAAEIVRLLTLGRAGQALIDDAPVSSGDIAILVRTNSEGRLTQKMLAERGVVSLLQGTESVFASREARELARLLLAIAEPSNEGLLKAALATTIIGLDGAALDNLAQDDFASESRLAAFRRYHERWQQPGFIRMFRELLAEQEVRPRLLAYPDGERRLTNLLQLGELIQQAIQEQQLTMAGVVKFLAERLAETEVEQEAHQLRLEREKDCVRIVTIHRAKGLEYPVVFCPFCWSGSRGRKSGDSEVLFHDPLQDFKAMLDLGSDQLTTHTALADREELAENVRLLYVAITRAARRCYLVWGNLSGAESSALAHLLHGANVDHADRPGSVKVMTDDEMRQDLLELALAAPEAIVVKDMPTTLATTRLAGPVIDELLACAEFHGKIETGFRIASFSSIAQGKRSADLPDHDTRGTHAQAIPLELIKTAEKGQPSIFTFPQGAGPGTFLHDLLEHLDFSQPVVGVQEALIRRKLAEHGFSPGWLPVVKTMLEQLFSLSLCREDPGFTLAAITPDQRLNEMEFYFPLVALPPGKLAAFFSRNGGPDLQGLADKLTRLDPSVVQGFMKGFIDCIICRQGRYYLLDWKSNFLGPSLNDYRPDRLRQVMQSELYTLQYLIYTVALNQHLALRLPGYSYERDFGGVYYVFLRGVDIRQGPDCGIFYDLPKAELIRELSSLLLPDRKNLF